jgi:cellobiose phosphorylase
MRFGYFDDENREYVITRPDTPLPWINYLGNKDFLGLISNTAGGYCFYKDASLRRLIRYRYNNAPLDIGGRYLYLRDNISKTYWSPSWMPTRTELDSYECRHGMGYSKICSVKAGIKAEICYFIPLDVSLEIWELNLVNQRAENATLSLFSAIEFALWDAWDDATNFQRNFNTGEVEVPALNYNQKEFNLERSTIFHKTEYRERRNHFAYFSCSAPLQGLIPSGRLSWELIAAGTDPWQWRLESHPSRLHMAGNRLARITFACNSILVSRRN